MLQTAEPVMMITEFNPRKRNGGQDVGFAKNYLLGVQHCFPLTDSKIELKIFLRTLFGIILCEAFCVFHINLLALIS